jgi:hypothetical protein
LGGISRDVIRSRLVVDRIKSRRLRSVTNPKKRARWGLGTRLAASAIPTPWALVRPNISRMPTSRVLTRLDSRCGMYMKSYDAIRGTNFVPILYAWVLEPLLLAVKLIGPSLSGASETRVK